MVLLGQEVDYEDILVYLKVTVSDCVETNHNRIAEDSSVKFLVFERIRSGEISDDYYLVEAESLTLTILEDLNASIA